MKTNLSPKVRLAELAKLPVHRKNISDCKTLAEIDEMIEHQLNVQKCFKVDSRAHGQCRIQLKRMQMQRARIETGSVTPEPMTKFKEPTKRPDTVLAVKLHAIGALTTCKGSPPSVMEGTPEWSSEYGAVRELVILRNIYQEQVVPTAHANIAEVRRLREENRLLRSQLRIVDIFETALRSGHDFSQPMGMIEDPTHRLERLIEATR